MPAPVSTQITQAQLETALLVAVHGNTSLLAEGIQAIRGAIAGAVLVGKIDAVPEWLQLWANRNFESGSPSLALQLIMVPALTTGRLKSISESSHYDQAVVQAARAEISIRPEDVATLLFFTQ